MLSGKLHREKWIAVWIDNPKELSSLIYHDVNICEPNSCLETCSVQ